VSKLSPNDRKVLAHLLEMASDHFANHGCNDMELDEVLPDVDARRDLMRRYHAWNGDPEEFDPEGSYEIESDFALMGFYAAVLRGDE
jgi:hypothetical protein